MKTTYQYGLTVRTTLKTMDGTYLPMPKHRTPWGLTIACLFGLTVWGFAVYGIYRAVRG